MSIFSKIKGIVYTTDPSTTPPTKGAEVDPAFDVQGRQVTYPYAVRGSQGTVATTMQNSTAQLNCETKILDADSSYYNDILMVSGVNSSDQAIRLNIHENFGGAALFRVQMAASSTTQIFFQTPWNQSEKGMAWYADFDIFGGVTDANDVTNTTVTLALQYIKNL